MDSLLLEPWHRVATREWLNDLRNRLVSPLALHAVSSKCFGFLYGQEMFTPNPCT